MDLSQRYKQAAKEARWALGLAIFYVIGWCVCAYLPIDSDETCSALSFWN